MGRREASSSSAEANVTASTRVKASLLNTSQSTTAEPTHIQTKHSLCSQVPDRLLNHAYIVSQLVFMSESFTQHIIGINYIWNAIRYEKNITF